MSKLFEIALGIVTGIGGFLEAGSLATAAQAGAAFGFQLAWASRTVASQERSSCVACATCCVAERPQADRRTTTSALRSRDMRVSCGRARPPCLPR